MLGTSHYYQQLIDITAKSQSPGKIVVLLNHIAQSLQEEITAEPSVVMSPSGKMLGYVGFKDGYLIYYFYPPDTHLLDLFTKSNYTVCVDYLNPSYMTQTVVER